ncbi:glycine betaine/L-proline ABC transporter ATP-binding protein [Phyllobacterium sp. 21LDTY02-6]|jgi:glycine betaine/proline transport system ATP-binding protein|uniref:quaternary amine ABC transporter ATP-binding protein n=1 Tax=unclassified Phyllobacterium TaxID=2638441 RepID=UPI0020200CB8|nr:MULTISPECIES: glycine betaine/L-proline ABC transporter ATP-binding protein [unclassified Phyllobacterium]MCO4316095.1 glycine betaine/L-proline ABC transporter ATP-binding protein [Phyllobacterium sp. 21LDTY02-6]MCX8279482.1 glycine betaine/L-proline ABC transporter ATP-binding protein [Phyllobacterium sp. 0TCS1.6C]MCX8292327.1 glycine betaine/L-proline ABC transporter ATP-binding protein [Phyllobacterium sp. 0TCS1.6A]
MANPSPQHAGIRIKNLYKIFGQRPSAHVEAVKNGMTKAELNEKHAHVLGLRDINIDMPAGCIQVVMGLSGSGKSTLIRHINRLIDPTAGEVIIDGDDVCKMNENELRQFRRHKTAMVFQKFALLPHRTVLDNTVYGLEIQGLSRTKQEEQARRWIERVGLKGFEDNYPNQLSGGMQQRVGLARALTNDAPILLMDEAFSALDPLIRMDMQSVLLDLQKEIKKTVVFITHDLDEALRLGDRIAILRDGEIVQQGTGQDIVLQPADEYISSFVKEVNRGRVIMVDTIATTGATPPDLGSVTVKSGTILEDAAKTMTDANQQYATVVDESGKSIGVISMNSLIQAMVTPISHLSAAAE